MLKEGLRIVSTGHYAPPKVVTNDDLSKIVDTNDEWISSRTGIRRRHFVEEQTNLSMALAAVSEALERADIDKSEIGACIVATVKPDNLTPSMACMIQAKLGLPEGIPCMDINAACSGFTYAMVTARGLLMQSGKKYGVIVGSETLSRMLDMTDRSTCVLFGDGAGAAVIELNDTNKFCYVLGSRGNDEVLVCPNGNTMERFVHMVGSEVFKFAVSTVSKAVNELLEKASVSADDIDYFICHQANLRIIESVAKKVKQPLDKFYVNLDEYGNTSSASIPLVMNEMNEKGMLKAGMKIICVGFGGGLTWGGAYLEW